MNESLNDLIIGNGTNVSVMEIEALEQHPKCQHNDLESFVDSASRNQVIEKIVDDKIRRAVDDAVSTVENRMHDANLTTIDKVITTRVVIARNSTTGSSEHGPNSEV